MAEGHNRMEQPARLQHPKRLARQRFGRFHMFQNRVALDRIQRFIGKGQALGVGHQIDAREQPDVEIQETGHGAAAAAQIQVE